MTRDQATQRQVEAANPRTSTWLAANAGSGKTRVLTDRVARLLYDGVAPQNILCLTYTKAAASEMQNRLFERLGKWTLLDSDQLEHELTKMGVQAPIDDGALKKARTLFARALETPGGLKIQTIHAFCASLLRRFPLEAGVPHQFEEIDDRTSQRLRQDVLEDIADGEDAPLFDAVCRYGAETSLSDLLETINSFKHLFSAPMDEAKLRKAHGADLSEEEIVQRIFAPGDREMLAELSAALEGASGNDSKLYHAVRGLDLEEPGLADLMVLERRLLYASDSKTGPEREGDPKTKGVPTAKTQKKVPHLLDQLAAMKARVSNLRQSRLALAAAQKSLALSRFAGVFLARYRAKKVNLGVLDFADLIDKAEALLTRADVAQWVLYRLEGGIDHILVDEAQDTSPQQWKVIERLSAEFNAGEGAVPRDRSIFVVGDKKQSIYSFQGADPAGFDRMRDAYAKGLEAIGKPLQNLELLHSFRSSPAILSAVDAVFADQSPALRQDAHHEAYFDKLPGRVDLWHPVEKIENPAPGEWYLPVDRLSPEHHHSQLAKKIVTEMRAMIGTLRPATTRDKTHVLRPVTAGDFLILLPRRSVDLFRELIRECKSANLPIAGSDQVNLSAELAVRDLIALLRFLSLSADDLSLAEALRSPLFGWSEQDLFTIAHGRSGRLYSALKEHRPGSDTLAILEDLRTKVDFERPYEVLDRILTRHHGRRNLLSRLGAEAEEGIDVLLDQALSYETSEPASLSGFLSWLEADEIKVKRTIDNSREEIRIMTIHGAKGLEAPIVILPDCADRKAPSPPQMIADDDVVHWLSAKRPERQLRLIEDRKRRDEDERQRLLYVAMTRAQTWLIVAAAGNVGPTSWFKQIQNGLACLPTVALNSPTGEGVRYQPIPWDCPVEEAAALPPKAPVENRPWLHEPVTHSHPGKARLSPSDLPGAKTLRSTGTGEARQKAREAGTNIHLLLEHLSGAREADWDAIANNLVAQAQEILPQVKHLLRQETLAHIFAPDTLSEVDISFETHGRQWLGSIDRLIVEEAKITVVDFKSNEVVPQTPEEVPDGILAQMGAYTEGASLVYPGREIVVEILWTRTGELMRLPRDLCGQKFLASLEA